MNHSTTEPTAPPSAQTHPSPLLTVYEAAEYLHVSRAGLDRIIATGDLPILRLPGRGANGVIRLRRATLDAYIAATEGRP